MPTTAELVIFAREHANKLEADMAQAPGSPGYGPY